MKTSILAFAFLLTMTSSFATEVTNAGSVSTVSSRHKNLFVFKAKKKLVGATVAIYSSNGNMITAQQLQKRKMVINFSNARLDTYTIRIEKGNRAQEFHYVKKQ